MTRPSDLIPTTRPGVPEGDPRFADLSERLSRSEILIRQLQGSGGGGGGTGPPGPAGGQAYTTTIGDAAARSFVLTHGLGSKSVTVTVYRTASPFDEVEADVEHTSADTITVRTLAVPSAGEYTVVVAAPGTLGGGTYVFTQLAPSALWIITHNLGARPSVTVVDSGETVVIPTVVYISDNELQVIFGSATSGKAYLN